MATPSLSDKRQLLAMVGGTVPPPMSDAQWSAIDAMAAQHRLQPLLAWRMAQARDVWPVQKAVAARWHEAREAGRLVNLALLAGLRLAGEALGDAGIRYTALKGPRLAWRCYPDAALRPMRDLDVLVAESDVRRAERVLCDAGFETDRSEEAAREALEEHQHLPPLSHPDLMLRLELHHRLTDPPARHGYRVPQLDSAQVIAASEVIGLSGVTAPCPAPTDLLGHLMVHALYNHRLDCGPLVLADIHFLLRAETVDGAVLQRRAEQGGWSRGGALLLALAERYFGTQPLTLGETPPESILNAAEETMLQDLSKRDHAVALADVFAARSPGSMAMALKRRLRPDAHVLQDEGHGQPMWQFWPAWAARRILRLVRALLDRRASREAAQTVAMLRWLQQR